MPQAKKNDAASNESKEMELASTRYAAVELREINSFDDAMRIMAEYGVQVDDAATEVGDSFIKIDDKNKLVDTPCLFMSWDFVKGDFGKFVTVRTVAQHNDGSVGKYVFVDGSVGVCKDLWEYSQSHGGKTGGLALRGGLTRSDYEVMLEDKATGELVATPATTFYVNTSK